MKLPEQLLAEGSLQEKHQKNTGKTLAQPHPATGGTAVPPSLGVPLKLLSPDTASCLPQNLTGRSSTELSGQRSLAYPVAKTQTLSSLVRYLWGDTEEGWLVPETWQGESWWLQRGSVVPAPDSAAHPWQRHNTPSETCWINKYSRDAPGHVFFMSSFCYWERHPLRRLDASGTEVIFIVNNLLEKLTLNISVQETHLDSLE